MEIVRIQSNGAAWVSIPERRERSRHRTLGFRRWWDTSTVLVTGRTRNIWSSLSYPLLALTRREICQILGRPVNRDVSWLGYCFKEKFYFDKFLSIRLQSAANICQRATNAVKYLCLFRRIYILNLIYLDDFAGVCSPESIHKVFVELGRLSDSCGIEESKQKACPPTTRMSFIGVLSIRRSSHLVWLQNVCRKFWMQGFKHPKQS